MELSPQGKQLVARALTARAWTLEKLAEESDIGISTVKNFNSRKSVSRITFVTLCEKLGIDWEIASGQTIASPSIPIAPSSTPIASPSTPPQPDNTPIQKVREHCRQKILNHHSRMRLLSGEEIGVDQLYVDVWLLNRSPRTFQVSQSKLLETFDLRNDRLGLGDRIQRNPGFEVANANPKLVILGKPGSGKTTFLKHLAVDWYKGKFQPDLIAVFIELRRIRDRQWDLIEVIGKELGLPNWEQIEEFLKQNTKSEKLEKPEQEQIAAFRQQVRDLLKHGKLLLLLDGLDEVPTSKLRRDVQNQLQQLVEDYPKNRLILTCRTQIVGSIVNLANLKLVEVDGLNEEQVQRFVLGWFKAQGKSDVETTHQWKIFDYAVNQNSDLKELSMTPILLSLICLVLQDSGEIPSQRSFLYQKGITLLLSEWNDDKKIDGWELGSKIYRELSLDEKESLLIEVAARKFENAENFILFEQKEIVSYVDKFLRHPLRNKRVNKLLQFADSSEYVAILKAIEAQHGLLIERADKFWSFSHLTFQEYFTAQWLNRLHEDQGLADKILDQRWQEVMKLAVESKTADRLLRLIKQAIDQSIHKEPKLQEFLNWVFQKSESVQANYQKITIRAFYFDSALDHTLDPFLLRSFDFDTSHALGFDFDPAHAFDLVLDRALIDVLTFERLRAFNLGRDLTDLVDLGHALNLALDLDSELADQLKQLQAKLPTLSEENWEKCEESWLENWTQWRKQLREVMIKYRNIGRAWKFTDVETQQIQHYYEANKFLVELMQIEGAVSNDVRAEIEDSLLLPWEELQSRQS